MCSSMLLAIMHSQYHISISSFQLPQLCIFLLYINTIQGSLQAQDMEFTLPHTETYMGKGTSCVQMRHINVHTIQTTQFATYIIHTGGVKKNSRFRSVLFRSVFLPVSTVPVLSVPFRSVHFRSNRLSQANSFSARHEFVCKILCVRWRSIARLFSTTRSRDGFFLP